MTESSHDPLLVRALRREPVPRTPVWLMRQAGRYLPEYGVVRKRAGGFLGMAHDPELAAEVTLQPVRRFGVDGAVIFSDILLPLAAMGMELRFEEGRGPVLPQPLASGADVDALGGVDPTRDLAYVGESLRVTRAGLPDEVALIGFAGAPFTMAAYATSGGNPGAGAALRTLMYRDTAVYERLMQKLCVVLADHLRFQVQSGAQIVVLFDTWAGQLTAEDYRRYVAPWTGRVLESLGTPVPRLGFVRDGAHVTEQLVELGFEAIVADWRTPIGEVFDRFGHAVGIQGNLDPAVLLAEPDEVKRRARAILDEVGGRPGHVLSLGHGVLKQTHPDAVAAFVAAVHEAAASPS